MLWIVEIHKTKPCYIQGDLGTETVLYNYKLFTSRKSAKAYIERQLSKDDIRSYSKSGISYCYHRGSKSWVEENTGERRYEQYIYKMFNCKPCSD